MVSGRNVSGVAVADAVCVAPGVAAWLLAAPCVEVGMAALDEHAARSNATTRLSGLADPTRLQSNRP